MLTNGCFYCGSIATTIDRIDSTLNHDIENCVASCLGCNNSKGTADPATFVRKAYYRARGEYLDDISNIWFVYKQKPRVDMYKKRAEKKGVPFGLTNEEFGDLLKSDCWYCKRTPDKWFGVDKVVPSLGYVIGNVVSCCWDCNLDKHEDDVDTMSSQNERVADRVDTGELDISVYEKMSLHKGTCKTSKKVCAYGNIYPSKIEAYRAIGKCDNYVRECIKYGRYSDEIFEIVNEN
jgi:5-methylcytosine-specific restriction endonuclease McrA